MKVIDILTSPWAIEPAKLREIQEIYATHLRGDKIDIEAIEARLGRPLANDQQEYQIRQGGVAVLALQGVIVPKANLFTRISGGTSAQLFMQQIDSAMADSRVTGLVIASDTPGGSVQGPPSVASAILAYSAEKPIVSVAEGQMASAGYWISSAAAQVYIAELTAQVGSIGVVATHDYQPNNRSTEITAGKYKRIATSNAPLSAEGAQYLQQQVDQIYAVFIDSVAQHRGVSPEDVEQHMADGRVFIGQQAIDAGLVDGVATVDQIVERMAANPRAFMTRSKARFKGAAGRRSAAAGAAAEDAIPTAVAVAPAPLPMKGNVMSDQPKAMTRETLAAENPALLAELRESFRAEGAKAERERVDAVRAQLLPGHEALIEQLAADGKTTGPEAAMAVNAAERAQRAAAMSAHRADAPKAAASAAANDERPVKSKAEQTAEAKAYAAQHRVDFVTALKTLGFAA